MWLANLYVNHSHLRSFILVQMPKPFPHLWNQNLEGNRDKKSRKSSGNPRITNLPNKHRNTGKPWQKFKKQYRICGFYTGKQFCSSVSFVSTFSLCNWKFFLKMEVLTNRTKLQLPCLHTWPSLINHIAVAWISRRVNLLKHKQLAGLICPSSDLQPAV